VRQQPARDLSKAKAGDSPVNVGFVVSFLVLFFCISPECCAPQAAKKQEPKVKVTVVVILANDRCNVVDPRLQAIAEEARSLEPKLTGFSMSSMTQASVAQGEKVKFTCIEDEQLEVTICQSADAANKVCLKVNLPHGEEIKYTVVCGKFLPFMTNCHPKEFIPPPRAAKALSNLLTGMPLSSVRSAELFLNCKCQPRVMVAICVEPCTAK
jgi:hypothetical protein